MILLALLFSFHDAFAGDAYDCHFMDGPEVISLHDAFSESENMRMGSIEIDRPDSPPRRWQTRVYQFLMPDHDRYVQMWYVSSELHVDAQFKVSSDNAQFAATLQETGDRFPLLCRKK